MALRASSKAVRRAFQTRMMTTEAAEHGPVGTSIVNKLKEKFQPNHLQVINESYMHNVPKGSETHFKVVVVSDQFSDMRILQRHRAVNDTLAHELDNGVHALSIMAKTPQQWAASDGAVTESPRCLGGSKR
eukprot:TRINITY_DN8600_c0_g1_i2.p1 TRINITY_DN8600_c0_g1~~TRINITY_DN8600_c0_g1_i2.p1  ORF type:complete len:131 (+),score=22.48 TRINITY_DN8600_c0_g1_i2:1-393(+)